MSRRPATVALAGGLLVALIAVMAVFFPVPYSAMRPGVTTDTLGVDESGDPLISISGRQTYPTGSGHLNLTTVYLTGKNYPMTLVEALQGWLDPDIAVVPKEEVYPDADQTQEQIRQENAELMEMSQQHATAAALKELGIEPTKTYPVVSQIGAGLPAAGRLHAGDVIVSVDGTAVSTLDDITDRITAHPPGEDVSIEVERDGDPTTVVVPTVAGDDGKARVGIVVEYGYEFPFDVSFEIGDIGGPSAGLMLALGIVDKLTPGEMTAGRFIAGTGTISDAGEVGAIGGIQQKIIGAKDAGAVMFLAPKDNCSEAVQSPPKGIQIVPVATLNDALAAIETLTTGDPATLPTCPR
ncbi:MAG: PDZ domain-containing protein [Sporichthyaceae bacterium]|nr:PDZ domain-containing protein [Sporichthyaceae bacterium]